MFFSALFRLLLLAVSVLLLVVLAAVRSHNYVKLEKQKEKSKQFWNAVSVCSIAIVSPLHAYNVFVWWIVCDFGEQERAAYFVRKICNVAVK